MLSVAQDCAGHSTTWGQEWPWISQQLLFYNNSSDRTINDKCLVNILHFACFCDETAYLVQEAVPLLYSIALFSSDTAEMTNAAWTAEDAQTFLENHFFFSWIASGLILCGIENLSFI